MSMDMQEINGNRFSPIIEKFYLNEHLADFHFIFKTIDSEIERVPAHKLLLTASDVFRTMFNGDWKDKTEVEIVDASPTDFKEFLKFFYLTKVNLTLENVGFIMNLGNKYNVLDCLFVCSKFLANSITEDNVCSAYGLASVFHQEKLKKYCELLIGTNPKAVLSSNGFLECDRSVLKNILDLDYISCSEAEVFEACMNWVKFKSDEDQLTRDIVQEQLGQLFYEFRFKSMSTEEFAMLLPSYVGIFTTHEYVEANQLTAIDKIGANLFSGKRRTDNFVNDGLTLACGRLISDKYSSVPYKIKEVEVTTFSVSEPVLLERFKCSRLGEYKNDAYYYLKKDLETEMEIAQVSEQYGERILWNMKSILGSQNDTVISLLKPILIRPNSMYEIRLKQSPPVNCVTGALLKSEVQLDSNLTVKFHRDAMIEGDRVARGLIFELIFRKI